MRDTRTLLREVEEGLGGGGGGESWHPDKYCILAFAGGIVCMRTPLIPSQQSSFIGSRTEFKFFQLFKPSTKDWSIFPSKMPPPCTHVYSEPLCETPRSTTILPH